MKTDTLQISSYDHDKFDAFIAVPKGDGPFPALIMIQEIFGINADMQDKCKNWAEKGYIAIAPDLFWRQERGVSLTDQSQEEWDKAFELFNGFNVDLGVKDLISTLDFIRGNKGCNGKVGSIGYCLGGKLAYLLSAESDIDLGVSYYGVGLDALLDKAKTITAPLLMHMAEEDKFVDKDAQAKITKALKDHAQITLHSYAGVNHAFTRLNGEHYDAEAAKLANSRTDAFVEGYLK